MSAFYVERMATVGKKIRDAREALGLTQDQLAKKLGVTRQAIGNWEKDTNLPKGKRAGLVASVLKLAPSLIDPFSFSSVIPVDDSQETFTIPVVPLKNLSQIQKAQPDMLAAVSKLSVSTLTVSAEFKSCFCVQVTDNSMAPDYHVSDEAIINPTLRPLDGDDVIVIFSESAAVLRRYRPRGIDSAGRAVFDLCTPNPDHVTVTVNDVDQASILGVVVEKRIKRRA